MATIADVARLAGVSKSTASRVLNDAPSAVRISAATQKRVLKVAKELGYRGNPFARAIRSARTQLLGVVAVSLVHPFWVAVIESIEEVARQRGYYLLLSEAPASRQDSSAPDLLTATGVNALLLLGDLPVDRDWLDKALAQGKTIVTVAWDLGRPEVPSVVLDNRLAMHLALEHLTDRGHEQIVLSGNPHTWEGRERIAAFRQFVATRGMAAPDDFIRPIRDRGWPPSIGQLLSDGAAALDEIWQRRERPTAVISGSSVRATGLLGHAYRRGIRVPDDLSVVAFADSALVEHSVPSLTAIDERVGGQGKLAATLVLDLLEQKRALNGSHLHRIEPRLVIRDSTGEAPRRAAELR